MSKRSRIVHVEWRTRNADRLKQFYKKAFRWKFAEPMPGYSTVDMGSKQLGGGFMHLDAGSPLQPGIISYLESDDLASTEAAVREAGGQVLASAQPVEGMGRFSIFTDPDGNQLAIWQSEMAIKKAEKRAKKQAKKADRARVEAQLADEKARRKAEKKAQKKAKADAGGAANDGKKKDKKKDKKKKDKKSGATAEAVA